MNATAQADPSNPPLPDAAGLFRAIFEQAAIGVAQIETATGRFLQANQRYSDIVGYSRQEMERLDFQTLTHPDDLATDLDNMRKLVAGEIREFTIEKRYRHKDGQFVWVNLTVSPLWKPGEPPTFHVAMVEDITERKQAEEALREKTEELDHFFSTALDLFCVADTDGCFRRLNPQWEALLGYPMAELEGRRFLDLIHPEDLETTLQAMSRLDKQQPVLNFVNRYRCKDGSYRWIEWRSSPWGKVIYAAARDITERKRVEEALRESEFFLSRSQEVGGVGSYKFDVATGRWISTATLDRIFGFDASSPRTIDSWLALVVPEERDEMRRHLLERVVRDHQRFDREYRIIRASDRAERWVHGSGELEFDAQGHPLRMIGTIQDITERKRAEVATCQRGEDLTHLLEVTKMLAITLDLKTVLQAGTDGASRLLGLGSAAIYLIEGEWLRLSATTPPLPPDLPEHFRRSAVSDHPRIQEALSTSRPVLLPDTATAELTPAERTIVEARGLRTLLFLPLVAGEQTLGTLIVGAVGAPRLVSEAQIDLGRTLANLAALAVVNSRLYEAGQRHVADLEWEVAERKRVELALRGSEERLRLATDAARMGVWERDLKSDCVIWSPMAARLNGFEPGEFPGTEEAFRELLHPDSLNTYLAARHRLREGDGIYLAELRFRLRNGRERWGMVSGRLIRNANGQPERVVGIDMDITERKRAEAEHEKLQAQLTQAQKMESVGRLAGGVAHDFNNMLTAILGHVDLALQDIAPASPLHEDLTEIQSCAQRSADLTRQLLAFARKQTIAPKALDLNETIEGTLKMLRRLIGEDIDLAWKPGRDLWSVRLDPSQVDQILANLCVNARDAIAGVGKVTIETNNIAFDEDYCAHHAGWLPGDYVLLGVSDNGCGMDTETLSHLFEPFFTTKEVGKGTGLGLATVYGAVKQNNGFVNVYSERDRGTTFKIYLPRHATKATRDATEHQPQAAARGSETVLVVEDEPAILNLTRRVLERLGYAVLAAHTPGEAIRQAREHPGRIDLLLTDVVMPEMNGRELASNILAMHPHIKRLYCSGYTADVIAHQGVLDPGVHFIQKPFSPRALGAKVREVLEAH